MALTLRRLRQNRWIRELTQEVSVSQEHMIQPLFAVEGLRSRELVPGLTGVYRETSESLLTQIEADCEAGVRKFILFGVPAHKSAHPSSFESTAQQISAIKKRFGSDLFLAVDVCLCSWTDHGHCGILSAEGDHIDNDQSVASLANAALAYAQAGADCVAPSDMMDGRIAAIRARLSETGHDRTVLMSYAAKFHSKFYGPFRGAANSAPKSGDRASYQIDPRRPSDALLSAQRDADEGADILMVKPGLPYLDVLAQLSQEIPLPWAVYEVSGEFAAIESLAQQGLVDGPSAHVESWIAFRRAGAQMILTYGARYAQEWLKNL